MFVSLEKFFSDYRIKNGQAPNETVLNRGLMRLKREIRELQSIIDIISNQDIEEYSPGRIYEEDEYVMYSGSYYRSRCDHNYANKITNQNFWELVTLPSIKDGTTKTHWQKFESVPDQITFRTEFNMSERPMLFIDGILQDPSMYTFNSRSVTLVEPIKSGRRVVVLYGYNFDSSLYLPYREFVASVNQDIFETPFQLVEPHVFVNGVLKRSDSYVFGRNYVQFPQGLKEGDVVVVANGNKVGMDWYNRTEIDNLLGSYYKKSETYNRDIMDVMLSSKADLPYVDNTFRKISDSYSIVEVNNILGGYVQYDEYTNGMNGKADWGTTLSDYRIEDAYTKEQVKYEIDNSWENQFSGGRLRVELDGKADKSSTLDGYGITDAYNRDEIDLRLDQYVLKSDYEPDDIVNLISGNKNLSAGSLNGYDYTQFMRTDAKTSNIGGIDVRTEVDEEHHLELGKEPVEVKYELDNQQFNVEYSKDGNHHYINIEGEFKGDFDFNILDVGICNPDDFNWTVYVQPTVSGFREDYIPREYGNGYTFTKNIRESKAWENTFYHFGYVEIIGSVQRSFVVHLKSFFRNGSLEMIPSLAHYKLVGVRKQQSVFLRFNQGSASIDKVYDVTSTEEAYQMTRYSNTRPLAENVLEDSYRSTEQPQYRIVGYCSRYTFLSGNNIQVIFTGLPKDTPFDVSFDKDVTIIHQDELSDGTGTAKIIFNTNIEGDIIVSCSSKNCRTGYVKLNIVDSVDDDIDTTMVFGETPWNHAVFTNGNTKYPLQSEKPFIIDVDHRLIDAYEDSEVSFEVRTDAPNIRCSGLDCKINTKEPKGDMNCFEVVIPVGSLSEDVTANLVVTAYDDEYPMRNYSITQVINMQTIKIVLPDLISVPLGQSVVVPMSCNVPASEITVSVGEIIANIVINETCTEATVNGLILGNSYVEIRCHNTVVRSDVVVYDPAETENPDVPEPEVTPEEPGVQEPENPEQTEDSETEEP